LIISPSLSAHGISTSAEEPYPLNSAASLATILGDVAAFGVGSAFLNLHRLFAYNAAQETYQRAFIVVQSTAQRAETSPWPGFRPRDFNTDRPAQFLFAFSLNHFNGSPIV
jgi:hypothetical protein